MAGLRDYASQTCGERRIPNVGKTASAEEAGIARRGDPSATPNILGSVNLSGAMLEWPRRLPESIYWSLGLIRMRSRASPLHIEVGAATVFDYDRLLRCKLLTGCGLCVSPTVPLSASV